MENITCNICSKEIKNPLVFGWMKGHLLFTQDIKMVNGRYVLTDIIYDNPTDHDRIYMSGFVCDDCIEEFMTRQVSLGRGLFNIDRFVVDNKQIHHGIQLLYHVVSDDVVELIVTHNTRKVVSCIIIDIPSEVNDLLMEVK